MNERNTILIAVLIIGGVFIVSNLGDITGLYVAGDSTCEYASDTSVYNPTVIVVNYDTNSDVPPVKMRSKCATKSSLSNVFCNRGSPSRQTVPAPFDYVCVDGNEGSYFAKGALKVEESKCVDSDGGASSNVKGVVTVKDGNGFGLDVTKVDHCATTTTVSEKVCSPSGKQIETKVLPCAYPKTCSDGACR